MSACNVTVSVVGSEYAKHTVSASSLTGSLTILLHTGTTILLSASTITHMGLAIGTMTVYVTNGTSVNVPLRTMNSEISVYIDNNDFSQGAIG